MSCPKPVQESALIDRQVLVDNVIGIKKMHGGSPHGLGARRLIISSKIGTEARTWLQPRRSA
jgi:hypothetical protein